MYFPLLDRTDSRRQFDLHSVVRIRNAQCVILKYYHSIMIFPDCINQLTGHITVACLNLFEAQQLTMNCLKKLHLAVN